MVHYPDSHDFHFFALMILWTNLLTATAFSILFSLWGRYFDLRKTNYFAQMYVTSVSTPVDLADRRMGAAERREPEPEGLALDLVELDRNLGCYN